MSSWVHTVGDPSHAGADAAAAVAAAKGPPAGVATLIVPADMAWSPNGRPAPPASAGPRPGRAPEPSAIGPGTTLLLGGAALRARGLAAADRLAQATRVRILAEPFPGRLEQGAGVPPIKRLSADPDTASRQLAGCRKLVLVDAAPPVRAFAEPDTSAVLTPAGCTVGPTAIADAPLTADGVAQVAGALLPEGAIVVDEANTSSVALPCGTARHDLLTNPGFAIGLGMPLAIGAALACPDRPVICLEADGSAMYTPSALWTQARERLNITTIVLVNRGYAILRKARQRLPGETGASPLFDLSNPDLDFVALAAAMGVPGHRAISTADLAARLTHALARPGPHLIEAIVPPRF